MPNGVAVVDNVCTDFRYFSGMPQVMPLAESRERAEQAHVMRVMGSSWRQIAAALGFTSVGGAQQAVQGHRKRNPLPDGETVRVEIAERRRITNQAAFKELARARAAGDSSAVAALIRTITSSDAETARMYGLAQERVNVTVTQTPAAILDRAETELLELAQQRRIDSPAALPTIDAEVVEQ